MSNQWIDRFHGASEPSPADAGQWTDPNLPPEPERTRKYLAFVSHELNNNLGGLLFSLHSLRKQLSTGDLDRAAAGDMLENAVQIVQDTVSATRRFLHVERARHAGAAPDPSPVRLFDLARRLKLQFAAEATQKGLELCSEVPSDAVVVSNKELIYLVLQNLVGNAVKFSSSGTVRIGADVDPATGVVSALWVFDEGPGISPEQLVHIFRAFRRGQPEGDADAAEGSDVRIPGGVGLGLTVASEAARLLGARLKVTSLPDRGATFSLVFP